MSVRFYSRLKSPTFVMEHGGFKVLHLAGGREHLTPIKPGFLKFKAIPPSATGNRIHLKGGIVNGILDSEVAAEELRKSGHQILDNKGEDITEQELVLFLLASDRHGIDFVSMEDESVEHLLQDMWIKEDGGGKFWCTLCERDFISRPMARKHSRDNEQHQVRLAAQGEHAKVPSVASQTVIA